jgi:hypothetical protein
VRYDPVNRDVVQLGAGNQLLTGFSPIGDGGAYMLEQAGCQHIRTVKSGNGVTHFYDGEQAKVMAFGVGESMWCISLQINDQGEGAKYFMSRWFLSRKATAAEHLYDAYYHLGPARNEYGLRLRGSGGWQNRFSRIIDAWIGGLDWGSSSVLRTEFAHDALYAIELAPSVPQQSQPLRLWRMYAAPVPDATKLFGVVRDASIEVVLNKPIGKNAVFGEIMLDSIGQWDDASMEVEKDQNLGNLVDSSIRLTQEQKNGWYRGNIIRDDATGAKLRGKFAILRLILDSLASDNRIVKLQQIVYRARESFKNYQ